MGKAVMVGFLLLVAHVHAGWSASGVPLFLKEYKQQSPMFARFS